MTHAARKSAARRAPRNAAERAPAASGPLPRISPDLQDLIDCHLSTRRSPVAPEGPSSALTGGGLSLQEFRI
jgi:hypothetical protein